MLSVELSSTEVVHLHGFLVFVCFFTCQCLYSHNIPVATEEVKAEVVEEGPIPGAGLRAFDTNAEAGTRGFLLGIDVAIVESLSEILGCCIHHVRHVSAIRKLNVAGIAIRIESLWLAVIENALDSCGSIVDIEGCGYRLIACYVRLVGGLGFTCTIEFVQLFLRDRCTDVDDLILNTLGAAIGALVFFAIRKRKVSA